MVSQLHFALRIKCIAQKLANLVQIEVCGFWRKSDKISRSQNFKVEPDFRQNRKTLIQTRFASFWVMTLIRSAKWSWGTIFFKKLNFGHVRNFWRQQILGRKNAILGRFWARFLDFRTFLVEISEVLPVKISTIKSGQISIFTGKKIKSFGHMVNVLMQNPLPPLICRFWTALL